MGFMKYLVPALAVASFASAIDCEYLQIHTFSQSLNSSDVVKKHNTDVLLRR